MIARHSLALQRAFVGALGASPALAARRLGIHDRVPPDAPGPLAVVGGDEGRPWGWKGGGGTEHRLQLTLWERSEGLATVKQLMSDAADAILVMPRAQHGLRIVTLALERAAIRPDGGPWRRGDLQFRARVIEENEA